MRTFGSDTDYLREDAVQRLRVDERDQVAAEPGTRVGVDDL